MKLLVIISFLLLTSLNLVYGQNNDLNETSDDLTKINQVLSQIKIEQEKTQTDLSTNLEKIEHSIQDLNIEINSLKNSTDTHESSSWGIAYLGLLVGSVIGITGWILGIAQLIPGIKKQKKENIETGQIVESLNNLLFPLQFMMNSFSKYKDDPRLGGLIKEKNTWVSRIEKTLNQSIKNLEHEIIEEGNTIMILAKLYPKQDSSGYDFSKCDDIGKKIEKLREKLQ